MEAILDEFVNIFLHIFSITTVYCKNIHKIPFKTLIPNLLEEPLPYSWKALWEENLVNLASERCFTKIGCQITSSTNKFSKLLSHQILSWQISQSFLPSNLPAIQ